MKPRAPRAVKDRALFAVPGPNASRRLIRLTEV